MAPLTSLLHAHHRHLDDDDVAVDDLRDGHDGGGSRQKLIPLSISYDDGSSRSHGHATAPGASGASASGMTSTLFWPPFVEAVHIAAPATFGSTAPAFGSAGAGGGAASADRVMEGFLRKQAQQHDNEHHHHGSHGRQQHHHHQQQHHQLHRDGELLSLLSRERDKEAPLWGLFRLVAVPSPPPHSASSSSSSASSHAAASSGGGASAAVPSTSAISVAAVNVCGPRSVVNTSTVPSSPVLGAAGAASTTASPAAAPAVQYPDADGPGGRYTRLNSCSPAHAKAVLARLLSQLGDVAAEYARDEDEAAQQVNLLILSSTGHAGDIAGTGATMMMLAPGTSAGGPGSSGKQQQGSSSGTALQHSASAPVPGGGGGSAWGDRRGVKALIHTLDRSTSASSSASSTALSNSNMTREPGQWANAAATTYGLCSRDVDRVHTWSELASEAGRGSGFVAAAIAKVHAQMEALGLVGDEGDGMGNSGSAAGGNARKAGEPKGSQQKSKGGGGGAGSIKSGVTVSWPSLADSSAPVVSASTLAPTDATTSAASASAHQSQPPPPPVSCMLAYQSACGELVFLAQHVVLAMLAAASSSAAAGANAAVAAPSSSSPALTAAALQSADADVDFVGAGDGGSRTLELALHSTPAASASTAAPTTAAVRPLLPEWPWASSPSSSYNHQHQSGLPPLIAAPVVEVVSMRVSSDVTKQYPHLSHLPIGAKVHVAEVDTKHMRALGSDDAAAVLPGLGFARTSITTHDVASNTGASSTSASKPGKASGKSKAAASSSSSSSSAAAAAAPPVAIPPIAAWPWRYVKVPRHCMLSSGCADAIAVSDGRRECSLRDTLQRMAAEQRKDHHQQQHLHQRHQGGPRQQDRHAPPQHNTRHQQQQQSRRGRQQGGSIDETGLPAAGAGVGRHHDNHYDHEAVAAASVAALSLGGHSSNGNGSGSAPPSPTLQAAILASARDAAGLPPGSGGIDAHSPLLAGGGAAGLAYATSSSIGTGAAAAGGGGSGGATASRSRADLYRDLMGITSVPDDPTFLLGHTSGIRLGHGGLDADRFMGTARISDHAGHVAATLADAGHFPALSPQLQASPPASQEQQQQHHLSAVAPSFVPGHGFVPAGATQAGGSAASFASAGATAATAAKPAPASPPLRGGAPGSSSSSSTAKHQQAGWSFATITDKGYFPTLGEAMGNSSSGHGGGPGAGAGSTGATVQPRPVTSHAASMAPAQTSSQPQQQAKKQQQSSWQGVGAASSGRGSASRQGHGSSLPWGAAAGSGAGGIAAAASPMLQQQFAAPPSNKFDLSRLIAASAVTSAAGGGQGRGGVRR